MINFDSRILWILIFAQATVLANAKNHPCRPNPCFNGGQCMRVSNNTRVFQCRCRSDYVGERCESTEKTISASGVLCSEKEDSQSTSDFACPPSTVMAVEYAAYGNPMNESSVTCNLPLTTAVQHRPCFYDGTLTDVMRLCHGSQRCSMPPLRQLFAHVDKPCKSSTAVNDFVLEYRFRCQETETDFITSSVQYSTARPFVVQNETRSSIAQCHGSEDYYENGVCFRIHYVDDRSKRKSWNDARTQCVSDGGDLAGPISPQLHLQLSERMKKLDERRVKYFWIGARIDVSTESDQNTVARWTTGAEVDYLPEGSKLDEGECMVYYVQPGRNDDAADRTVWLAKSCSLYYNWICQIPTSGEKAGTPPVIQESDSTTTSAIAVITSTVRPHRSSSMQTRITRPGRTRTRTTTIPITSTTTLESTTMEEASTVTTSTSTSTTRRLTTTSTPETSTPATTTTTTAETTTTTIESTIPTMETTDLFIPTEWQTISDIDGFVDPHSSPELPTLDERGTMVFPPSTVIDHRSTTESGPGRIRIKVPVSRPVWILDGNPSTTTTPEQQSSTESTVDAATSHEEIDPTTVTIAASIGEVHTTTVEETEPTTTATTTTMAPSSSTPEIVQINGRVTIMGAGTCESVRERGINWPSTSEGIIAEKPCPVGLEGTARWECRRVNDRMRFFPIYPDLSDCRHAWFQEVEKQLKISRYALKIAEDLERYLTMSTKQLYGGDITRTLSMLDGIFELESTQLWQQSEHSDEADIFTEALKFTKHVGGIVDYLMAAENVRAWQDFLLHDRMVQLSSLMRLVEENASFLSRFMLPDNSTRLNFTNYVVKVEVHRIGMPHITIPSTSQPNPLRPVSNYASGIMTPDSDAVSILPTVDADFSLHEESAQIILPSKGILAAAREDYGGVMIDQKTSALADAASPFSNQNIGDKSSNENTRLRLAYFVYARNLNALLQPSNVDLGQDNVVRRVTVVNSQIIGAIVNEPHQRISLTDGQNVTLTFKHLRESQYLESVRCVYWNPEQHSWDTDGCDVANSTSSSTTCTCNHLTSFAILMDINGDIEDQADMHRKVLKYLTMAGCALSAACLVVSLLVFTCFKSLWSIRNSVHRNLCFTLLIGELLFLFGINDTKNKDMCTAVAVLLHYFFLAAFAWMFMEGYQLYAMLVRVFEPPEMSQLIGYYIVSYGAPAAVVAVSVGLGRQYYGTETYCWIDAKSPVIWAFVGPVAFVTLANMVFLAVALRVACRVNTAENRSKAAKIKGWLKGSTMLLCLLGLTWVFGFFFVIRPAGLYFAYIFTVLNSLQGVFIFVFHVFMNEKVHALIGKWFKKHHGHFLPNYYSVNTKSNGSSNESRHNWPTHFTVTSTAASYSFPASPAVSSINNDQREMMENGPRKGGGTASNNGAACRRRYNDQNRDEFETFNQHRQRIASASTTGTGYLAGDDEQRKNVNAMPVQIVHRNFDDEPSPDQRVINEDSSRYPISKSSNGNGTSNGSRHMLFISTSDREDRQYPIDYRKEPIAGSRFYYSTDGTVQGQESRKAAIINNKQKFVQHF